MATAAATAARVATGIPGARHVDADVVAIAAAAAVKVYEVSPLKAPAAAALAAKEKGGSDAVATAVAAGVAAAAVGWNTANVEKISKTAVNAFINSCANPILTVAGVAAEVAREVRTDSSRYPAVEAAAAAAYAASLTGGGRGAHPFGPVDAPAAAAAAAAAAAFACSDGVDTPYDTASYALTAAARAAVNRGAPKKAAVAGAARALKRNARFGRAEGDFARLDAATAAAAAAASAVTDSAPVPVPIGTFGAEGYFEAMPDCHEITKGKLQTILEVDTFLAGFLLFSLTGRKEIDSALLEAGGLSGEEEAQVILQTFAFGVFLAATILTGLCTICTGGRYALTSRDLVVPFFLSGIGFVLLLVSVASAIHIELGGGFYGHEIDHKRYWLVVGFGLGCPVLAVFYGLFVYLHGHKYNWTLARSKGGWVCGIKAHKVVHTEPFRDSLRKFRAVAPSW